MKKVVSLCLTMFIFIGVYCQDSTLDQMLVNVNQSTVTSGIIYERTAAFSGLYYYNLTLDTADADYFEQAEKELYDASNKTKFISTSSLRSLYTSIWQTNTVDVGVLNSQYQFLNYNTNNPSQGGLMLGSNNLFYQISGQSPFLSANVTVVAPLKKNLSGTSFVYTFKSSLLLNNGTRTIKAMTADLGDGVTRSVITNGTVSLSSATINYSQSGYKYLKFSITYNDNSSHVTFGKIYVNVLTFAPPFVGEVTNDFDLTPQDISENPDLTFKGYDESVALPPYFKYRIFYGNGNTQKKILKPIIISDGFDPGDLRQIEDRDYTDPNVISENPSIETKTMYTDCDGSKKNLLEELTKKGYDVIVVNYPTYLSSITGKNIDGGADYIERNAMGMIMLIRKINKALTANASQEKLVIVGPSMGGQITRYALAYMEKQYAATNDPKWLHKTRLWISVDSPHLGANIPEGLQALVNLLKMSSPKAEDFYNQRLGSVAAKQQLINWHQEGSNTCFPFPTNFHYCTVNTSNMNGRTTTQGWATNSGSSFYQTYYNNQFNNGLPNSKGYPMNLRKISLVNGSVTGKAFGTDGQQVLNLRGFTNICFFHCWDVHVASIEGYTLPTLGTDKTIAYFKSSFNKYTTHAPNNDSRGNVDILPGGYYNGYDQLNKAVLSESRGYDYSNAIFRINLSKYTTFIAGRVNAQIHSFIPTFSALGMKNPNQSWAQSVRRNLVYSNEIPFDSYFGHDDNTEHTSFDCQSVAWLFKELDGIPQAPWFPLKGDDLIGPAAICANVNTTYNFPTLAYVPSTVVTWTPSANLQVVSFTTTSVVVKGIGNGNRTITATFTNGETLTKTIFVGAGYPQVTLNYDNICGKMLQAMPYNSGPNTTGYLWTLTGDVTKTVQTSISDAYGGDLVLKPLISNPVTGKTYYVYITVKGINNCGTSDANPHTYIVTVGPVDLNNCKDGGILRTSKIPLAIIDKKISKSGEITLSPNPAHNIIIIKVNQELLGSSYSIVNSIGAVMAKNKFTNKVTTVNLSHYANGTYVLVTTIGHNSRTIKFIKAD